MFVYGYCRISTPQQNIERQVRNIAAAYPAAHIVREVYTGTACQGRRELDKLLRIVQEGDTIVFDSVSRMSRSADEGCALYETLYKRGVNLCFLKEPHINTDTYKQALQRQIGTAPETGSAATDRFVAGVMDEPGRHVQPAAAKCRSGPFPLPCHGTCEPSAGKFGANLQTGRDRGPHVHRLAAQL